MAGTIHDIDPDHLVTLGTIGGGQCGTQGADYQYVYGGGMSVCELHNYAWSVTTYSNPCAGIGKPYFAGERGFACGDAGVDCTAATQPSRASSFGADCSNAFASKASGYLPWSKSAGLSGSYDIGPGDPAGQTLNSCYRVAPGQR
jgi:hypothetical protein